MHFPTAVVKDTHFVLSFLKAPGIYSSTEMLDFGTLRTQGESYILIHLHFRLRVDTPHFARAA